MDTVDEEAVAAFLAILQAAIAVHFLHCPAPIECNPSLLLQKLNWCFANTYGHPRIFKRHLRMSRPLFEKLLLFVKDDLTVNESMASLRGGAIIPELCLYCTIRYLAGGSYTDILYHSKISTP